MCNAYNLKVRMAAIGEAVERQLGLPMLFPPGVTAETSNTPVPQAVYPRRDGLILRAADANAPLNGLEAAVAHWNLTPFFHKGPLKAWKASTNNCRSETMATSPAFRDAFKRRRCLIPATSFTEWTGPTGKKTAHAISRADGGLLFLAGLWERCLIEGEETQSYTMVMQAADKDAGHFMSRFHTRQPIVLGAETAVLWLDVGADAAAVLNAPPEGALVADPPEPVAA